MAAGILDFFRLNLTSAFTIDSRAESILNPNVILGDFTWAEPITTLTDFLIALVAGYAFYKFTVLPVKQRNESTYPWFKYYFLCFAVGMTSAAWLGHGFQAYISSNFKMIGWLCGATGLMLLQNGSISLFKGDLSPNQIKTFRILFLVQWVLAFVFVLNPQTRSFMVTQINSVVGLIFIVLPMHIIHWRKKASIGSRGVVIAIAFSLLPGLVYRNQISVSRWFNYHDISHVLVAIFMAMMYFSLYRLANKRK